MLRSSNCSACTRHNDCVFECVVLSVPFTMCHTQIVTMSLSQSVSLYICFSILQLIKAAHEPAILKVTVVTKHK